MPNRYDTNYNGQTNNNTLHHDNSTNSYHDNHAIYIISFNIRGNHNTCCTIIHIFYDRFYRHDDAARTNTNREQHVCIYTTGSRFYANYNNSKRIFTVVQ